MAEELKAHENPPLTALNRANIEADKARREEVNEALTIAQNAMRQAFDPRSGRRIQKPLRSPVKG